MESIPSAADIFGEIRLDPATQAMFDDAEKHIARCVMELARLRRGRNGLLPVARLPTELLVKIITLAWEECAQANPSYLLGISNVCSHWRDVVLGTPALWSRISLERPSHLKELLKKSAQRPLMVVGNLRKNDPAVEAFKIALENLTRIRSLDLHLWDKPPKGFKMVRKQNLRNMHSIALSGERYIHGDTNSLKWMSKLQLPSLQKFRVKDLRLAVYKNLLLPTLTCLSITGDSQGMSVSTILSTLSALPRLETLALSGCVLIPDDRNGYRSGLQGREPKTVLTHLRSLSLEANLIECATLLSSLDVPMGTDLRMVLNGLYYKYRTNSKPLLMTEVLSPIQTFIQNVVSAHPLTKLAIRKTRRESIITERYEDYVTWRVAPEGSSSPSSQIMTISVPRSRIHLSRLEGDDGVRDALLGFLVSQDLASLQVEIPMMAADWKRKLGALVNVRRLWVTGADQEFIGALSSQGGAPLLFPRLQHLVIEEDGTCCFDEKFARNVSAGLKSRKTEKRQKLERLDVRCVQTWPHGPVKRLQGVVGTLTFLTPFRISELSMEETFDTEEEMSELEDSE